MPTSSTGCRPCMRNRPNCSQVALFLTVSRCNDRSAGGESLRRQAGCLTPRLTPSTDGRRRRWRRALPPTFACAKPTRRHETLWRNAWSTPWRSNGRMRIVTAVCVWKWAVVTVSLFWKRWGVSDNCRNTKKVSARVGHHFHVLLSAVLFVILVTRPGGALYLSWWLFWSFFWGVSLATIGYVLGRSFLRPFWCTRFESELIFQEATCPGGSICTGVHKGVIGEA